MMLSDVCLSSVRLSVWRMTSVCRVHRV